ncbi:MAG: single-stranded DNA-binding protein [Dehalococcoidia bacterium]|nr:single-stranded DNA-binding protein [Dehalococcoidia bacterium]
MVGHIRIIVIGNVGTDPEMRYTAQGTPVTTFRLASSRVTNNPAGERDQATEWFTVVSWRQLAEQVNQYLNKGRRAYVEGRLQSRSFEGKDSKTHFINEIVADRVLFLDRAPDRPGAPPQPQEAPESQESKVAGQPVEPEDLPF